MVNLIMNTKNSIDTSKLRVKIKKIYNIIESVLKITVNFYLSFSNQFYNVARSQAVYLLRK